MIAETGPWWRDYSLWEPHKTGTGQVARIRSSRTRKPAIQYTDQVPGV